VSRLSREVRRAPPTGSRRRSPTACLLLPGILLGLAVSCRARPAQRPTSLLLVTIDTLRADRVGCYGHAGAHTPNLDRLCSTGVVFENAFAPAPVTLPSHASILTGVHPAAHRLHTNATGRLGDGFPTLAEVLRPRLARTGAVVGSLILNARFGLARGFDDYDDRMPPAALGRYLSQRERPAREVAARASDWLRRHASQPFFLWVHFYEPHAPYEPPAPWKESVADPYDGEIAAADEGVGTLLAALGETGALDRTLLIVAGDHGEDLGQHGEPTHGIFLYDTTLRVPLIVGLPGGSEGGRRVADLVRLVDLMPTAIELFGLPASGGVQGRSLVPLLHGEADDPGIEVFAESHLPEMQYGWSRLAGLREREWMYVRAPEEELYSMDSDPGQKENVAALHPARLEEMRRRLGVIESALQADAAAPRAAVSEEMRRQIESLGYIGGEAPPQPGVVRADPKRRLDVLASLSRVGDQVAAGRAVEAEGSLRAILAADPGNPYAMRLHARSLAMMGREAEARLEYEKLLAVGGEDGEVLNSLGSIDLRRGRLPEAERYFRRALEISAGDTRARNNLAFIVARRGKVEEAARMLEEVLEDDPMFLDGLLNLALLRAETGDRKQAQQLLRLGLERMPGEPAISETLAGLLAQDGSLEEAAAVVRRALDLSRDSAALRLALGGLLEQTGRPAEAAQFYREILGSSSASPPARQAARRALERLESRGAN